MKTSQTNRSLATWIVLATFACCLRFLLADVIPCCTSCGGSSFAKIVINNATWLDESSDQGCVYNVHLEPLPHEIPLITAPCNEVVGKASFHAGTIDCSGSPCVCSCGT